MTDNKKGVGEDRKQVAGGEPYEVNYEAKKTGKTPTEVKAAVKKVGNSRTKVEAELKKRK